MEMPKSTTKSTMVSVPFSETRAFWKRFAVVLKMNNCYSSWARFLATRWFHAVGAMTNKPVALWLICALAFIMGTARPTSADPIEVPSPPRRTLYPSDFNRQFRHQLRRADGVIFISNYIVPTETTQLIDRALASGINVVIYNSRVLGPLTLGSAYAPVVRSDPSLVVAAALRGQNSWQQNHFSEAAVRAFVAKWDRMRVISASLDILDSVINRIDVSAGCPECPEPIEPALTLLEGSIKIVNSKATSVSTLANVFIVGDVFGALGSSMRISGCWFGIDLVDPSTAGEVGNLHFDTTVFDGSIRYGSADQARNLSFESSTFRRSVILQGRFDRLAFRNSVFEGDVMIHQAKVARPLSFDRVVVRQSLHMFENDLADGGLLQLLLDPEASLTMSYWRTSRPLTIATEWSSLEHALERGYGTAASRDPRTLIAKISALRIFEESYAQHGLKDVSLVVYRERKRHEARLRAIGWRIVDRLVDWTCGYGTQPYRVLLTALFVTLCATLAYYSYDRRTFRGRPIIRIYECWLFSIQQLLSPSFAEWVGSAGRSAPRLVMLPWESGSHSLLDATPESPRAPLWLRTVITLEGTCGWFLLALLAASLARSWID